MEWLKVHIEPVPPRCTPGAILAFVCDGGGFDRSHVGKITLLGASAEVEIAADKATAAVKALDGAALGPRPVRVRLAQAGFGHAHFARLGRLLDLEAVAEQEELRRAAQADSAVQDGTTLNKLTLRDAEFGLGGRLLLTFAPETPRLPPNRLQPGAQVVVSQVASHRRRPAHRGVV